ncbi:MAG: hypothetical protein H5T34_02685 [Candidatus Methanomethyliales bacterium]|nr:hypothetical protein [Candidatus Methanomethylicales archaeon]
MNEGKKKRRIIRMKMRSGKGKDKGLEEFKVKQIYGLEDLLEEFEKYCYTKAIVTISGGNEVFAFDLSRVGIEKVKYGYAPYHEAFIKARILRMLSDYGSVGIIVRSFLKEKHEETGYPYKELRGYIAKMEGERIVFKLLPVEELYRACNTDTMTGKEIPPEREAVYCGPDGIISERARIKFIEPGSRGFEVKD